MSVRIRYLDKGKSASMVVGSMELATTLLQMSLGKVWPGVVWSVLDARRGRFHDYKPATIPTTKANVALLHSEACAFGSLWTSANV